MGLQLLRQRVRRTRAQRAEQRQRAYQVEKALDLASSPDDAMVSFTEYASSVKGSIERFRPIDPHARVLEVGSGAHGLIFFLGLSDSIGIDPLADIYPSLFPKWQRRAKTIKAYGESLPFEDGSFDLVLCDNVIDHAESPEAILAEIARVLRPGGTLFFTVHVHHPIYALASHVHAACCVFGGRLEFGPFADHTVHFTLRAIRSRLAALPFHILTEDTGIRSAKDRTRDEPPRHLGDRLKRLFFKNARFEIVATRRLAPTVAWSPSQSR